MTQEDLISMQNQSFLEYQKKQEAKIEKAKADDQYVLDLESQVNFLTAKLLQETGVQYNFKFKVV